MEFEIEIFWWVFVSYLRQKSSCWTPSTYTTIKDWILENWFAILVKTSYNRGNQTWQVTNDLQKKKEKEKPGAVTKGPNRMN